MNISSFVDNINQPTLRPLHRLILVFFLMISTDDSFSATSIYKPHSQPVLIATKNNTSYKYNIGASLFIRYDNYSKKLSGQLYGISKDSVLIQFNSKQTSLKSVAISDISSISVLHKKGRKNWVFLISLFFILMALGLILYNKGLLISIPLLVLPVVSLYTFVPFLGINFMSDVLSKKSIKKGWSFKSESSKY